MGLGRSDALPERSTPSSPGRVTALQPFNQAQFDACAGYFAWKVRRPLTQLDLIKLHVLTDFFHILARGRQVIGGEFLAWQHGPVVEDAYKRVSGWRRNFDRDGDQPPCLQVVGIEEGRCQFTATGEPDLDEFSQSEIEAMDQAVKTYNGLKGPQSANSFFHGENSYFGRAWRSAREGARGIDLIELIEGYDVQTGEDHADVKTLIG
jgi:hypothetical protein